MEPKELMHVPAIRANGGLYLRCPIATHFVTEGEDYLSLVRTYVLPRFRPGDLLAVSEKVIALCQGRTVREEDLRPGALARLLARCVRRTPAGPGAGDRYKMQFAIDLCGAPRVVWAALRAGADKLRGVHGTFYRLTGREVAGLDGFYGREIPEYAHLGIRIPDRPDRVCREIYEATGVPCVIVDANDLNVELLGRAPVLTQPDGFLLAPLRDNPAGQDRRLTPFVLVRPVGGPGFYRPASDVSKSRDMGEGQKRAAMYGGRRADLG